MNRGPEAAPLQTTFVAALALLAPLACGPGPTTPPPDDTNPGPPASPHEVDSKDTPTVEISDDPLINEIATVGLHDSAVDLPLEHLTKVIGPRLTSSHALMEAEQWARDQFVSFGLDAQLERWGEYPVGFDRGPAAGGMVSPERVDYDFTTPAWTPGVFGPARGPALPWPASAKALRKHGERYRGAWVVVPRPAEDRSQRISDNRRETIEARLRDLGVLGYIHADGDAKGELVHTGGRHEIDWTTLPTDVHVRLRGDQFDDLLTRVEQANAEAPVELEFSIDNRFFRGPVPQHNVIADLVGTELPDEYVIIGGHIDSWDGAEGAVDNATGVATTLEAARLLSAVGAEPRRTIRFMLWSGEEQGLFGSRAYVADHPEALDNISAVLVHDGGTNYLSGISVTPEMYGPVSRALAPLTRLAPEDMPFAVRLTEHLSPGSSDHDSFIAAGVPGFFWHQAGQSNYRCMHHTQLDIFEAAIDEYQRHSAVVVAIAALELANADALLDRQNAFATRHRKLDATHDWAKIEKVPSTSEGRARKAGLKPGDVIVSVDDVAVSTSYRVRQLLNTGAPQKKLRIRRGTREFDVDLDFSDDPEEQQAAKVREQRLTQFGPDIYERIAEDQNHHPLAKTQSDEDNTCTTELKTLTNPKRPN